MRPHEWTDADGYVLIVKTVNEDMTSHGGFVWPTHGPVEPDHWSREPGCESGGLFGWPWGLGIGDGKEARGRWIVFRALAANVIFVGPEKVKAVPGEDGALPEVIYCGEMAEAMRLTMAGRVAWIEHCSDGAASATGDSGAASATGVRGAASATGVRGAASATGDRGAASATGYSGAASATGECGFAFAGWRAKAGSNGAMVIRWWDDDAERYRFVFGTVGDNIQADTWYEVRDGQLREVSA